MSAIALLAAVAFAVGLAVGRWWALRARRALRSTPGTSPYRVPAVTLPALAEEQGPIEFTARLDRLVTTASNAGANEERLAILDLARAVLAAARVEDRAQARAIVEAIEARGTR